MTTGKHGWTSRRTRATGWIVREWTATTPPPAPPAETRSAQRMIAAAPSYCPHCGIGRRFLWTLFLEAMTEGALAATVIVLIAVYFLLSVAPPP